MSDKEMTGGGVAFPIPNHIQRAEEGFCNCTAAGSGFPHTDWCEWSKIVKSLSSNILPVPTDG